MFTASCILLCFAVTATHQHVFKYVMPWDPFRRSIAECEMCYKGECVVTRGPRCEYYAEASKLTSDEIDDRAEREIDGDGNEIDTMLYELVDSASSRLYFKSCIPFVSQYTDCTEENICTGCKFCSCNEEGRWICSEKQTCTPELRLSIDHRIVGIVIEYLKRKEKLQKRRIKRTVGTVDTEQENNKHKVTYTDISKWMYGVEPFNFKQSNADIGDILEYLRENETTYFDGYKDLNQSTFTTTVTTELLYTDKPINQSDNYVDLLEFNDILQSWTTAEISTTKPFQIIDTYQTFRKHRSEEIHINDVDYTEYNPIRFIKRDTSKLETNENQTLLQINTTSNNFTYELILIDAIQGLNKITSEKQKELEELLKIQNNLLNIAKEHNIAIDINSTITNDNYNKHHIAIYKLDTFEKCVAKIKHDICNAIKNVIETDAIINSSDLHRDLKLILSTIRSYVFRENNKQNDTTENIQSSQERDQNPRRHFEPDYKYEYFNPIVYLSNILVEINKAPANPLNTLSKNTRKILKRVIKQLYFDDFAVIDYIVHETYYDFENYLENIGTKWNKMIQDVTDSEVYDTMYRVKQFHMTLKADISKMENMITLLDFARNRRMTVANGGTIDKSILRIQNNLQLIDNNVQKILKLEKNKRMRQPSSVEKNKSTRKKTIFQKLKKMFQSSKNDIKEMLRKRFPKSEIIKEIAKKKRDELEKQNNLKYHQTMKQWQDDFNVVPGREKRYAWGFQALGDRIKSIIPGYLKRKVKPAVTKKRSANNLRATKMNGRKKHKHTKPTTIKTTMVSRTSTKTLQGV